MLLKAIISSVDVPTNTAQLILPEYDNAVTADIPFYKDIVTEENKSEYIGKFVVFAVFGTDFNDGVIL